MAKKEKVTLRRTEDFDQVDHDLAEAMAMLDEANARVSHVLESGRGEDEEAESLPGEPQPDAAHEEGEPPGPDVPEETEPANRQRDKQDTPDD